MDGLEDQALAQLRKIASNLPKSHKKLVSFLSAHFRPHGAEAQVAGVIENLTQKGYLAIDVKGAVNYWLEQT